MVVALRDRAFDPWQEVAHYQREHLVAGRYGATAVFVGTMRDFRAGEQVVAMTLEHYPGMTEKYLADISAEAAKRWAVLDSLIVHRCGRVQPAEPIVLVAVWAAHRGAASDACRYMIEELKARAPFWKHEQTPGGGRWVEGNSSGY